MGFFKESWIIIIIALVGIGSYYLLMKNHKPASQENQPLVTSTQQIFRTSPIPVRKLSTYPTPTFSQPMSWKTYIDPSGKFSLQYPPSWTVTMMHIGNESDKNDVRLAGNEGKIDIIWVRTYGGACPPAYEKISLKNETVYVCHELDAAHDREYWGQISKQLPLPNDPTLGVDINAQTNAPSKSNRATILQMLSTVQFFH